MSGRVLGDGVVVVVVVVVVVWVRGHARDEIDDRPWVFMRACILFLQLGAGAGRARAKMCFVNLTSLMWMWFLEVQAHRYWVVGFWDRDGFSYLFGSRYV